MNNFIKIKGFKKYQLESYFSIFFTPTLFFFGGGLCGVCAWKSVKPETDRFVCMESCVGLINTTLSSL